MSCTDCSLYSTASRTSRGNQSVVMDMGRGVVLTGSAKMQSIGSNQHPKHAAGLGPDADGRERQWVHRGCDGRTEDMGEARIG